MTRNERLGLLFAEIALLLLLAANVYQLSSNHADLVRLLGSQESSDPQIAKVDAQLDALASGTRHLAEAGNPNAVKIMQTLAQNGINIKPRDQGN